MYLLLVGSLKNLTKFSFPLVSLLLLAGCVSGSEEAQEEVIDSEPESTTVEGVFLVTNSGLPMLPATSEEAIALEEKHGVNCQLAEAYWGIVGQRVTLKTGSGGVSGVADVEGYWSNPGPHPVTGVDLKEQGEALGITEQFGWAAAEGKCELRFVLEDIVTDEDFYTLALSGGDFEEFTLTREELLAGPVLSIQ